MLAVTFHHYDFLTNFLLEGIQFWTERLLMNQKKSLRRRKVFFSDPIANGRENRGMRDFARLRKLGRVF